MAFTLVNVTFSGLGYSDIPFTIPTTGVGNALIVVVAQNKAGATLPTIADSVGDVFTEIAAAHNPSDTQFSTSVFWAVIGVGGATTVTVTSPDAAFNAWVYEVSRTGTMSLIDSGFADSGAGTSTSAIGPNLTADAGGSDKFYVAVETQGAVTAVSSPWVLDPKTANVVVPESNAIGPIGTAIANQIVIPGSTIPAGFPGAPNTNLVIAFKASGGTPTNNVYLINTDTNTVQANGTLNIGDTVYVCWFNCAAADIDGFLYSVAPTGLNHFILNKFNYLTMTNDSILDPVVEPGNARMHIYDVANQGPSSTQTVKIVSWGDFNTGQYRLVDRDTMTSLGTVTGLGAGPIACTDRLNRIWIASHDGSNTIYCLDGSITFSGSTPTSINTTPVFTIPTSISGIGDIFYDPVTNSVVVMASSIYMARFDCVTGLQIGTTDIVITGPNGIGSVDGVGEVLTEDLTLVQLASVGTGDVVQSRHDITTYTPNNLNSLNGAWDWQTNSAWVWRQSDNTVYRINFGEASVFVFGAAHLFEHGTQQATFTQDDNSWSVSGAVWSETGCGPIAVTGGSFQDASGNLLAGGKVVVQVNSDARACDDQQISAGVSVKVVLDASGNVVPFLMYPTTNLTSGVVSNVYNSHDFYFVRAYNVKGQLAWQSRLTVPENALDLGTIVPTE